ncbi:hypothetical protein B0H67DRAFT_209754 [Lasiosphaeris hirsuta]|uniref:Uncharacterized protein n=1 Tax=Lasiosphaeris hirsuta TaxID=260670 RepID=A0AA40DZ22_9PEZI|nr:hypothetical protein B0H67DRAFT_209754 [Lasiosphaeris hirsuta]
MRALLPLVRIFLKVARALAARYGSIVLLIQPSCRVTSDTNPQVPNKVPATRLEQKSRTACYRYGSIVPLDIHPTKPTVHKPPNPQDLFETRSPNPTYLPPPPIFQYGAFWEGWQSINAKFVKLSRQRPVA